MQRRTKVLDPRRKTKIFLVAESRIALDNEYAEGI